MLTVQSRFFRSLCMPVEAFGEVYVVLDSASFYLTATLNI